MKVVIEIVGLDGHGDGGEVIIPNMLFDVIEMVVEIVG
jgi:hypothetical protein